MFLSLQSHKSPLILSYFHTFRRIAPREQHLSADGGYVPVDSPTARRKSFSETEGNGVRSERGPFRFQRLLQDVEIDGRRGP